MNQKGFTLIELLGVIAIIGIVLTVIILSVSNTHVITEDSAYKIMQNNIIESSNMYIMECEAKLLECNYKWINNETIISANNLIQNGYIDKLINPITNKDISNCLKVIVKKDADNYQYKIDDSTCK